MFEFILAATLYTTPPKLLKDTFIWKKYPVIEEKIVTAYTIGDDYTPSDIMANGEKPYIGAVASNDYPLGTKLIIGNKIYTVCDRMAEGGRVDIYMNTIEECLEYGVHTEKVIVE